MLKLFCAAITVASIVFFFNTGSLWALLPVTMMVVTGVTIDLYLHRQDRQLLKAAHQRDKSRQLELFDREEH